MSLQIPNASEPAVEPGGGLGRRWYEFLDRVVKATNGPFELRAYTVARLPTPPADGFILFVSDAGGGAVPVYSRGGVWRRFDDNAEVT